MPINRNGSVTTGTRANLIEGLRSAPMDADAVDAVLDQAARFTEELVQTYDQHIAAGEVGDQGCGEASDEPILGPRPPAALLYGRVQSGKTAAMVLTSALALDNGFKIIVVLTADNVELVRQTANRFKDLDGPRVLSTLREDDAAEWRAPDWEEAEENFTQDVQEDGLVFVCAKNALHIPQVLTFLRRIDAPGYPCLILDDEADAATPDLTVQARTSGRRNAPEFSSTIYRRVVENDRPGEEGESALELLPHSIYVQVTASPFVLFLQRTSARLHPTVTFLLNPGPGYCGGERFFSTFDPEADDIPAPPLILVPDREYQLITARRVPQALADSVEFALVAAAALAHSAGRWPDEGYKHLSHTSPRVLQHGYVADHIERHIRAIKQELRDNLPAARARFDRARTELGRSFPGVPPIDDLMPTLAGATRQAQVIRINAATERPAYGPRVNFLVGGNILGRGLTIKNLLVTYYLRQAQVPQMDTVLQHARMYGYREALMPYTRVYLPRQLATLFRLIHDAEESLRLAVEQPAGGGDVPIRVAQGARPTRPGPLEGDSLRVFSGNLAQASPVYPIDDPVIASEARRILAASHVPLNANDRDGRSTQVPLSVMRELIQLMIPKPDDPGRWSVEAILGLIREYEAEYRDFGTVYVRPFAEEPDPERRRARLSGPEVTIVRRASPNLPALVLLYWEGRPELWYPTMVFPSNMPTYIFGPP